MSVRISVPIPVFNGEKYLPTQLNSILKQLSEEDEVVISYNKSNDSTWDIITDYEKKYKIIKVIVCETLGVLPNSQNALKHCRGKYILFADQDDYWLDRKVECVLTAFSQCNPPVVLHNMRYANGDLQPSDVTLFKERHSHPGLLWNLIKNSYHGGCMAIDSKYIDVFYPIPAKIGFGDRWVGLVGEMCGNPVFIPEVLMLYRRHENNLSPRNRRSTKIIIPERIRLIIELYKRKKNIKRIFQIGNPADE